MGNFEDDYSSDNINSVSIEVVEQLAAAENTDPRDFPPLFPIIDLEALDRLIESGPSNVMVCFSIDGHEITVTGDGTVELTSSLL
ncbi:HalOD1 output domain-containing protein [Halalkalicoccus paucihalophilus]|uniref:HalOD1 output domain-containing protein n=1 Tax=Halalkalicoccus paucihalophilus TaxID=1008153 RepID=UPI0012EDF585|nr:HalOD1 output domain-containing protein [Halalkalicoccus paucihalophilus]